MSIIRSFLIGLCVVLALILIIGIIDVSAESECYDCYYTFFLPSISNQNTSLDPLPDDSLVTLRYTYTRGNEWVGSWDEDVLWMQVLYPHMINDMLNDENIRVDYVNVEYNMILVVQREGVWYNLMPFELKQFSRSEGINAYYCENVCTLVVYEVIGY